MIQPGWRTRTLSVREPASAAMTPAGFTSRAKPYTRCGKLAGVPIDLETGLQGLSMARSAAWLVALVLRYVNLRPQEPPIFDVNWRFYDEEPAEDNSVGIARFQRTWRRGAYGKWQRLRERSAPLDTHRTYVGKGYLRDRRLKLDWIAEDRPNTFGVLFLTIDEDCRTMNGYTVFAPQDTGAATARRIWFKRG